VTQESIDAVLEIWAANGTGFSWQNDYFHFTIPDDAPWGGLGNHLKPYTRPHPPMAVAGVSKSSSTLRWAGERGWIPMSINFVNSTDLVGHWAAYAREARWEVILRPAPSGGSPVTSTWRTPTSRRGEALENSLATTHTDYFLPAARFAGYPGAAEG